MVAKLRGAAGCWRHGIEERWEREHAPRYVGEVSYAVTDSSAVRVYDNPNNPALGGMNHRGHRRKGLRSAARHKFGRCAAGCFHGHASFKVGSPATA